jgi:uncharacterized protein YcbK (DUF882 family)
MSLKTPPERVVNLIRRRLLLTAAVLPAVCVAGRFSDAQASGVAGVTARPDRSLTLVNTHTGESLGARYFEAGQYAVGALDKLSRLLRDHRTGEMHRIDPQLFDVLHHLAAQADQEPRFEVISGYRSPATNGSLHARSKGVASRSLHMEGRAIDVRLARAPCTQLRDLAMRLGGGGVGYYKKSDFVHLDTGRVRFWSG